MVLNIPFYTKSRRFSDEQFNFGKKNKNQKALS